MAQRLADIGWLRRARQFFVSPWGLLAEFCLAAVVVLTRAQISGLMLFVGLLSVIFVLCDDILATLPPLLLATLFLMKANGNTAYGQFAPLVWLCIFPLGAITFHLYAYQRKKKVVKGRAVWALLGVSVALLLGGVGYITPAEYFAGTSLYHMGMLGLGMLLTYLFLSLAVQEETAARLPEYISNVMVTAGLFACFMVFHHYIEYLPRVLAERQILAFQWRNNVSTIIMLALPFPFYKAFKRPAFLLTALLMYLAMLLSGSRGGLLFGTVELLLCILFVLLADKKRRMLYIIMTVLLACVVALCLPLMIRFLWPTVRRLLMSLLDGEQEVRMGLWRRAIQDFLRHPVFGTGIGYMGNRDIHPSKEFALCWYHCAPLQIIGSLGVVGVAAYGYLYVTRVRVFLSQRSKFHLTLLLSWVGLELMSLVNPGVFAPVPYLLLVTMFMVFAEKVTAAPQSPG